MSYSGLGIVRSLGRRGIPVVALDPDPRQIGMSSRFACALQCPDQKTAEADYLSFLLDLGKLFGKQAVYFPTGDNTVLFFSRHRNVLEPYYRCVMPDADLVEALVSKEGFDRLCTEYDIPAPQSFFPKDRNDVESHLAQLPFPAIIKPIYSHDWKHPDMVSIVGSGTKALSIPDAKQLFEKYDNLAKVNPSVVIQEFIPGPDYALYYFCGYMDHKTRPLAVFVGQKLRVEPIHFGSASFVKSIHDQDIIDMSLRFLEATGYVGLCGIEYKRDSRDGQMKAIEFNARFGLWDILATRCGIDIPYIAYQDAVGQVAEKCLSYRTGVKWVSMALDYSAFKQYRREGTLSLVRWLMSFIGEKQWAVADLGDLVPFVETTRDLLRKKVRRISNRLWMG